MDPRRSERVSETIRVELEEMISYELSDPRIEVSAIAEVLITPDGRRARVRVLMPGDAEAQKITLDALNHAKAYIRGELASRIDLFRVPELQFEAAVAADLGARMEHLLKRVRRGRPRPDLPPDDSSEKPSK